MVITYNIEVLKDIILSSKDSFFSWLKEKGMYVDIDIISSTYLSQYNMINVKYYIIMIEDEKMHECNAISISVDIYNKTLSKIRLHKLSKIIKIHNKK